ncbi:thioredoxin family protein [Pareuzebyella sediminis]|uniref:thioredoxin family protein n=1 Tax=Pareuzebyella sediminis TaxID=2607998 RepID=UPI0011EBF002|nr:thioredoxin family protein [Pareuzebyella sediminis]
MTPIKIKHLTRKKSLVERAIEDGISYVEFRKLVGKLVNLNSNTGLEKNEALANYTMLNEKRMARWDKTFKVPESVQQQLLHYDREITWLVITESWCGDASPSLPIMNKLAELAPGLTLKIVQRDEHPELMDAFLTQGTRSIPKLIMIDSKNLQVLGEWGPRPAPATKMVQDYKNENGKLTAAFRESLQVWYNKDKGQRIVKELIELITD